LFVIVSDNYFPYTQRHLYRDSLKTCSLLLFIAYFNLTHLNYAHLNITLLTLLAHRLLTRLALRPLQNRALTLTMGSDSAFYRLVRMFRYPRFVFVRPHTQAHHTR